MLMQCRGNPVGKYLRSNYDSYTVLKCPWGHTMTPIVLKHLMLHRGEAFKKTLRSSPEDLRCILCWMCLIIQQFCNLIGSIKYLHHYHSDYVMHFVILLFFHPQQQRLFFHHQLRKFNLPHELLTKFYSAITESVLSTCIMVWFGSVTKSERRKLQKTLRPAERIISAFLPILQDIYVYNIIHMYV